MVEFYPVTSPLGDILIAADRGIPMGIILPGPKNNGHPEITTPGNAVRKVTDVLKAFFKGDEPEEEFTRDILRGLSVTDFARSVLWEVSQIPRGSTLCYGEVAARAGYPGAARAVGNVMRSNSFPIIIPCHRVIRSDGSLGGYGGQEHIKAWLLGFEGSQEK